MPDTTFINIALADWTEVGVTDTTAFLTNNGGHTVIYREADGQPSNTDPQGHQLRPGDNISYTVAGAFSVWARTIPPNAVGEIGRTVAD